MEPTIPRLLDQTTGSTGVARLAAFEVLVHYVLLSVSIAGLAIAFRLKGVSRVQVVFIVLLTCAAYALIGTTILNGGTLHRLRQPYIAFHCIFAAAAVLSAWDHRVAHKRAGSAFRNQKRA
jgi:hypothetical protein